MRDNIMSEQKNIYGLISKHRSELMGVAIIIVMLFHLDFNIDRFPFSLINYPITICGSIGVDIFLLVSGFGLYLSLQKNNDFISYFKKRLIRILPAYYPVISVYVVIYALRGQASYLDFLSNFTLTSWWIDRDLQFNWYVQVIPFFYLLAVPFAYFFRNSRNYFKTYFLLSLLIVVFNVPFMYTNKYQAFARFPIFIWGMMYGALYKQGDEKQNKNSMCLKLVTWVLLFSIGVLGIHYFFRSNKVYSHSYDLVIDYLYQMLIPLLFWVCCFSVDWLKKNMWGGRICIVLRWIGEASFEIYLLHLLILMIRPDFAETYNWIRFLLIVIFCSLGILYHKVMQLVVANVVKR